MNKFDTTNLTQTGTRRIQGLPRGGATTIALLLCFLSLFAGYAYARFGSLTRGFAYIRGERLVVEPTFQTIDNVSPGRSIILKYNLANLLGHPIELIGSTASCSCTVIEDIPVTVDAFSSRGISVKVMMPGNSSNIRGHVTLFTNYDPQRSIDLSYHLIADGPGKAISNTSTPTVDATDNHGETLSP